MNFIEIYAMVLLCILPLLCSLYSHCATVYLLFPFFPILILVILSVDSPEGILFLRCLGGIEMAEQAS